MSYVCMYVVSPSPSPSRCCTYVSGFVNLCKLEGEKGWTFLLHFALTCIVSFLPHKSPKVGQLTYLLTLYHPPSFSPSLLSSNCTPLHCTASTYILYNIYPAHTLPLYTYVHTYIHTHHSPLPPHSYPLLHTLHQHSSSCFEILVSTPHPMRGARIG